jgi:2-polyprenyl-3-methyl-5-hydroxy-6-metoxy-1,4-benzoquinol methylase
MSLMKAVGLRKLAKLLLPSFLLNAYIDSRNRREAEQYKGLSTQQIFTKIYESGAWGKSDDPGQTFFSGSGSHESTVVSPYIQAVQDFLTGLPMKPTVVDLGCGDFFVGSKIRHLCSIYTACDIVPSLIKFNREKFQHLDVNFRVLDLAEDDLPNAEVVFIRQVLQHLSNEQIAKAIPKIARQFKFLVLSEHLPADAQFIANADKPSGPDIRMHEGSGLVLTLPPFNLPAIEERVICEVPEYGGIIRTIVYKFSHE